MTPLLDGATRVIVIVGDPIAQVKSPGGVTAALLARGRNAVVVPMHVGTPDFDGFMCGLLAARNVDGIIATVPHKFAAFSHCASVSETARLLGAANVLRRNPDGSWHGDMLDGAGFVAGIKQAGCATAGRRALLAGAGGAGSAIALALLDAGVSALAIHDANAERRDGLIARLAPQHPGRVLAGSASPRGFEIVVNATPMGMRAADPLPIDTSLLTPKTFVGDVITAPEITPLLQRAQAAGCGIQTGVGMFRQVQALMVTFFLETLGRED